MMALIRVIALALALAGSSWSSHPSESARNQYGAGEDRPQPQLLAEATDHPPEVHMSEQTGLINNSTNSSKQATTAAPDLQVGCGDGFIHEKLHDKSEVDKNRAESKSRGKRSYTPWTGQVVYSVPYPSISVWKPSLYQIQRPYFIPVYGVRGRVPIYYPPQPLYINAGAPKDNPGKRPFRGPSYLPPRATTPKMEITDRFKDEDQDGFNGDDRPIWDGGETNNQLPQGPTQRPTTEVVPTRRTRPPGVPKRPPLIHNPTDPEGFPVEAEIPTTPSPPRQTQPTQAAPAGPSDPGRCVWAIISCCTSSNQVIFDCFEQRGCPGPFWDANPCDSDWARSAVAAALNYYN